MIKQSTNTLNRQELGEHILNEITGYELERSARVLWEYGCVEYLSSPSFFKNHTRQERRNMLFVFIEMLERFDEMRLYASIPSVPDVGA